MCKYTFIPNATNPRTFMQCNFNVYQNNLLAMLMIKLREHFIFIFYIATYSLFIQL